MKSIPFTECVDLVGSRCKPFNGTKKYVSTGAVDVDQINEAGIEIIDYEKRPSRANLEASLGDVLFAKMQGTKKTLLINSSLVENIYSTGFCAVKAKKNVLTERCLYHLLTSKMFLEQKDKNCSGATQKAITNKGLQKVILHVPDINKQDLIAAQLDLIVKIITLQKQELVELDDLIKARFVELFGDPVSNQHGYEKVSLSELADIKIGPFGSLLHKEDYIEGGHPLLNPSHIVDGKVAPDYKLSISEEKYNELSAYQLHVGDVVMGRRGEMGRCAIVPDEGYLCGTGSLMIRTKGDVTADYIQKVISFPSFKKTIEDMAVGQTMPNLNVPIVSSFQIIKPPIEVQNRYYAFVAAIDKSKLLSGCRLFHSWAPENRDKPKHVGVPRRRTKDLREGRRQQ